ncbi:MAG: DUF3301 domain-containing protein [Candidatus Sedimenticola endophacoides]
MPTLLTLLLFGALIWFWLDSARARELAVGICGESCQHEGLQFLDQTVVLKRLGLRWTAQGVRLRRTFQFDYSEQGDERRSGQIVLVGIQLEVLCFEPRPPRDDTAPPHPRPDNVIPLRHRPSREREE